MTETIKPVEKKKLITVYYDGKCGLCSKEINYYIKIAPKNVFHWCDITRSAAELNNEGITLADGLRLLHVKDTQNQIHIGLDSFILIWRQLPVWWILAKIMSIWPIRKLMSKCYVVFANWRFKRLSHCQLANNTTDSKQK